MIDGSFRLDPELSWHAMSPDRDPLRPSIKKCKPRLTPFQLPLETGAGRGWRVFEGDSGWKFREQRHRECLHLAITLLPLIEKARFVINSVNRNWWRSVSPCAFRASDRATASVARAKDILRNIPCVVRRCIDSTRQNGIGLSR